MTRPCSCCACCFRVVRDEADAGDEDAAGDDAEDPPPVEQLVRAAARATATASPLILSEEGT
jgi:hypothetical protein